QNESERAFLAIGGGAERWLRAAAASGTARVRAKMAQATELALLFGSTEVDQALSRAASVARFSDDDLISILAHAEQSQEILVWADEGFSAQPGTEAWAAFGR
ncbi:MAG TPA: IS21 family transposase, partial [Candidatus Dormibacteraeota bacterium]|nr:IS21 family transposase [Candidatus Dormibacteraeota bacterium]